MELEVSTIYTTRDIILNALRHVWPWFSKSKVKVTIVIYLFEFRDIDLVLIDTKHTFLRYILPEIYHFECVTSCFTLNVKVKRQGHDIDIYLFEFCDIDLVPIDTKHKFLRYIIPEISYWMRYVMFDLEFEGQMSRSQPWNLFFWIPWHPLSNRGHQTQVSITCTTRDIIFNALRHVWPWILRSKVKVTILAYNFLTSLTSV